MTFTAAVLAASLAVSASDRLAMADRLFNRGDFAAAKTEYLALAGEQGLDRAAILYRLVASGKALKENAFVRAMKWPGLMVQKITTAEPDDSMLEVAIAAMKLALDQPYEQDEKPEEAAEEKTGEEQQ